MLASLYVCNYGDRAILSVLAQPIKLELNISDTQLVCSADWRSPCSTQRSVIPRALSERLGRVNVIAACSLLWSGATALSGTAANYAQLTAYRFGVGIGDSGLAAPAMSLISDYYPPTAEPPLSRCSRSEPPSGSCWGPSAAAGSRSTTAGGPPSWSRPFPASCWPRCSS